MSNAVAHIDLLTLKLFVAIIDEGGIAKAAWRENITTSAVSKRISEMEARFGTALLIRQRQGAEPTAAGSALLPHCRAMLSRLAQIDGEMRDFRQGIRGQIRISANESATIGYLPGDIAALLAEHPAVQLDFQVDTSPVVVRKVMENAADIGVFTGSAPTGTLEVVPYRQDRLVAVLPSEHPLTGRAKISFTELLDFDMIGSEASGAIEALTLRAASNACRTMKTRIRVGSFDAACRFVEAGLGVTVVTETVAATLTKALDIAFVHLEEDWAKRQLNVCVRERSSLPAATALLLAQLIESRPTEPAGRP